MAGAQVRRVSGNRPPIPAIERARQAWADMARQTRTDLRHIGVTGPMRRISDVAGQTRVASVPAGLYHFAEAMREAGVPLAEAAERISERAKWIAALAYQGDGNDAA